MTYVKLKPKDDRRQASWTLYGSIGFSDIKPTTLILITLDRDWVEWAQRQNFKLVIEGVVEDANGARVGCVLRLCLLLLRLMTARSRNLSFGCHVTDISPQISLPWLPNMPPVA